MLATQFRVTDEAEMYLCAAWALVFDGSVLAYNPARDKVEWVPASSIANDLSWVEEKSAVALANFVPRISQQAAHIAGLGTHHLVSWPNDSSSDDDEPEGDEHEEAEGQGEVGPKSPSEQDVEPQEQQRSQEWGSIMDEEEPLAFDDLWLDSDTTVGGCSPVCSTPQEAGSPQETAVEVHAQESEVEAL